MMSILQKGAEILTKNAATVTAPQEFVSLADSMVEIVKHYKALGLAASQVGVPIKLIVCVLSDDTYVMFNPILIHHGEVVLSSVEGCLSLKDRLFLCDRSASVTVAWLDKDSQLHQKKLYGQDAIIVQHEVDHTRGVLISDHGKELLLDKNNMYVV